ncbi:phage capsid protein [Ancylobacter sp. WKF20]|uniref:phage capsid protein n=1 Tax=Ancylobacter sp. WKF20 TaxID=3039801 RepID=UPI002434359D|nr:phage capsid protein [Ancylobacter sp. WKF20]WGD31286.1 phage capsid protein [Ancylobacter sp. WKF20]
MLLAPNWFVEEYRSNVRHIFQSQGFKLKPTVTPEGSITGKTVKFPYFGTFEMQEKTRGGETPPANPDHGFVSADLKDYDALYEIQEEDLNKMTANERQAAQQAGGMAVGRKSDSLIMNAMNAAVVAAGSRTFGTGGDFGFEDALLACEALADDDQVVWDGNVTAVISWRWWHILSRYKEFNNAEWVGAANLGFPAGTVGKRWNNVNWVPFQKKELLIPAANQAYGFIFHRNAVGYATNYEGKVNIQWDNRQGCWTVRFDMQSVATALYPGASGIYRLHYATNTSPQSPVQRTQTVS